MLQRRKAIPHAIADDERSRGRGCITLQCFILQCCFIFLFYITMFYITMICYRIPLCVVLQWRWRGEGVRGARAAPCGATPSRVPEEGTMLNYIILYYILYYYIRCSDVIPDYYLIPDFWLWRAIDFEPIGIKAWSKVLRKEEESE
jgi:hypothetical protein